MNLLQNSIDETSITLLSCSLSLHNFRSSLALATFLGAFLCRALLWALHRRRLSTGTHLKRLLTTIVRCSLRMLATETDASRENDVVRNLFRFQECRPFGPDSILYVFIGVVDGGP